MTDPLIPKEVREALSNFALRRENGQIVLNLNDGFVQSYKTVRYVRVVDKKGKDKRQSA